MDEHSLKGIDLNLLVVFAIVMREGSTTAAASQLCLTQSAVSQSLRRLRLALGDELFVRDGKGISPTPWALALYRLISPSLASIGDAIRQSDRFDPATESRRFRIRFKSNLASCIAPRVMKRVQGVAPGISVQFSTGDADVTTLLDKDDCDLVISVVGTRLQPWHREHRFSEVPIVSIFDGKRLGIKPPISRKMYLTLPHLLGPRALAGESFIDALMARYDLTRPQVIITNDYAAYPLYLKKLDAIANCPLHLAHSLAEVTDLTISAIPFNEQALYQYGMIWHARNDRDAGHGWLRDLCIGIVDELDSASGVKKHRALA